MKLSDTLAAVDSYHGSEHASRLAALQHYRYRCAYSAHPVVPARMGIHHWSYSARIARGSPSQFKLRLVQPSRIGQARLQALQFCAYILKSLTDGQALQAGHTCKYARLLPCS